MQHVQNIQYWYLFNKYLKCSFWRLAVRYGSLGAQGLNNSVDSETLFLLLMWFQMVLLYHYWSWSLVSCNIVWPEFIVCLGTLYCIPTFSVLLKNGIQSSFWLIFSSIFFLHSLCNHYTCIPVILVCFSCLAFISLQMELSRKIKQHFSNKVVRINCSKWGK
jgi:hypothetical protein